MGHVAVSNRVIARNSIGEFIAKCEEAATATVKEAVQDGAKYSKAFAPKDTTALADSIEWRMTGATSGEWRAGTKYAMAQEKGASAHEIVGSPNLAFYWEKEGRDFIPASVYYNDPEAITVVHHPGNPAHPYLRPAYELVMSEVMSIARQKYPG